MTYELLVTHEVKFVSRGKTWATAVCENTFDLPFVPTEGIDLYIASLELGPVLYDVMAGRFEVVAKTTVYSTEHVNHEYAWSLFCGELAILHELGFVVEVIADVKTDVSLEKSLADSGITFASVEEFEPQ